MISATSPVLLSVALRTVMHWQPASITFLHAKVMLVGDRVAFGPGIKSESPAFAPSVATSAVNITIRDNLIRNALENELQCGRMLCSLHLNLRYAEFFLEVGAI